MSDNSTSKPDMTGICNLALTKLGESPITAPDPNGTPAQRLCYLFYHPARREVLCANAWTFAKALATLETPDAEASAAGHPAAHTLPADCLRVLKVASPMWTLRGLTIYCPEPSIRVLYVRDEEDTSLFDPLFVEALATRLACKLCIPLTGSSTARKALTEEYRRITLPEASHFNAVQAHSNDSHPLYQLWLQSRSNNEWDD